MYFGDRNQPKATTSDDRRSVMRRHLIYYLRVWDVKADKLLGHVVDINADGFMLISEKQVEPEKTFDLEIRWNTPDEKKINIQFQAESRWSTNDVNPSFFDTGFKLIGPTDDVLEPIREMIEEYGFQN
jgi:PilZ domain